MLERAGTVVARDARGLRVQLDSPTACIACAGAGGCGIGPLLKALHPGPNCCDIEVPDAAAYHCGDRVCMRLPAPRVLQAAVLAYALPLLGLAAGALAGAESSSSQPDAGSLVGALLGLGLACFAARQAGRRYRPSPQLLRLDSATGRSGLPCRN